MSLPLGPWLDSDAARAIGPVEMVCVPRPQVRVGVWLLLVGLVLLGVFLVPLLLTPGGSPLLNAALVVTFFAALVLVWWLFPRLSHRLLVGTQGMALWTRTGGTVVYWDALGNLWRLIDDGSRWGRLVLESADGRPFVVDWLFTDDDLARARVLEELERNRLGRQYERQNRAALPDRLPEREDLPQGPWTHSDAARRIGPLEAVHGPRATVVAKTWFTVVAVNVLLAILLAGTVAQAISLARRPTTGDDWVIVWIGAGLVVVLGVIALFGTRPLLRRLSWRVLIGARGVAEWHPDREVVVPWIDLGETWLKRPSPTPTVRLVLEHLRGPQMILTTFYADVDRVVDRVEAERVRHQNLSPAERRAQAETLNTLLGDHPDRDAPQRDR
jgi:hypothetical protein